MYEVADAAAVGGWRIRRDPDAVVDVQPVALVAGMFVELRALNLLPPAGCLRWSGGGLDDPVDVAVGSELPVSWAGGSRYLYWRRFLVGGAAAAVPAAAGLSIVEGLPLDVVSLDSLGAVCRLDVASEDGRQEALRLRSDAVALIEDATSQPVSSLPPAAVIAAVNRIVGYWLARPASGGSAWHQSGAASVLVGSVDWLVEGPS